LDFDFDAIRDEVARIAEEFEDYPEVKLPAELTSLDLETVSSVSADGGR